jgi:hypothetical protein
MRPGSEHDLPRAGCRLHPLIVLLVVRGGLIARAKVVQPYTKHGRTVPITVFEGTRAFLIEFVEYFGSGKQSMTDETCEAFLEWHIPL